MTAAILSIGTEILLAQTRDTNFPFLAAGFTRLGVPVVWHATVPDHLPTMIAALREARQRADVVITIGGLGPTVDDRTRDAVVAVTGRPLSLDPDALATLRARFASRGFTMTPGNEVQARVPRGAVVLENANGSAPGLLVEDAEGALFVFPGPPRELIPMAESALFPWVEAHLTRAPRRYVTFRTVGVAESALAEALGAEMQPLLLAHDIAYLPHWGMVDVRVAFDGADPAADARDEAAIRAAVHRAAPRAVFGEGTITHEEAIGAALRTQGRTVACAESLTGGRIAARLIVPAGASEYVLGGVVAYGNRAKEELLGVPAAVLAAEGAVSEGCARAMALGARERLGADLAVSSTGIAGPGGAVPGKPVGLVFLAVATPEGVVVERREFPGVRAEVTHRATLFGLELLRRVILGAHAVG